MKVNLSAILAVIVILVGSTAIGASASGLLGDNELSMVRGGCNKATCQDRVVCTSGPVCYTVPQPCIVCGDGFFLWWNKRCIRNVPVGSLHCDDFIDTEPGCGRKLDGHCIQFGGTGYSCSQDGGAWYGDCGSRLDCREYN